MENVENELSMYDIRVVLPAMFLIGLFVMYAASYNFGAIVYAVVSAATYFGLYILVDKMTE